MTAPTRRYFAALEGYRALAALAVVVYHFAGQQLWTYEYEWVGRTVGRFGNLGVCVFFVLSGFVLYRPRVAKAWDHDRQEPIVRYVSFRLLRILPAYWLALGFLLLAMWENNPYELQPADLPVDVGHHVLFFGLLQVYEPRFAILGLGVAWTLCIEVAFYLTLPAMAWVIARIARSARTPRAYQRRQLVCLAVLAAVGFGFRALMFSIPGRVPHGVTWPIGYLTWFAAGMALAVLSCGTERGVPTPRVVTKALGRAPVGLVFFAAIFATLVVVLPPHGTPLGSTDLQISFVLSVLAAVALLTPVVLGTHRERSLLTRSLVTRPLQFLGTISYGIYLWHHIWIRLVSEWQQQNRLIDHWLPAAGLVLALTFVAAMASYTVAEEPALRWKTRLRNNAAAEAAPEPARQTASPVAAPASTA